MLFNHTFEVKQCQSIWGRWQKGWFEQGIFPKVANWRTFFCRRRFTVHYQLKCWTLLVDCNISDVSCLYNEIDLYAKQITSGHTLHMNDQFIRSQKHKRSKYFLLWLDICWLKLLLNLFFNIFLKDTLIWQELSTRLYLCFCLQFIALRRRYMLILPPLHHDCCL